MTGTLRASMQVPNSGTWIERYRGTLEVAAWCGGLVVRDKHRLHIQVDGARALPGDRIVPDGNGFEVIASGTEADL